ncbi:MAG: hypothetical protein PHP45_00450 [Elusimicrobiales bacterium]|nr:hypothetical protein [Elusimicrobiales bacterium]
MKRIIVLTAAVLLGLSSAALAQGGKIVRHVNAQGEEEEASQPVPNSGGAGAVSSGGNSADSSRSPGATVINAPSEGRYSSSIGFRRMTPKTESAATGKATSGKISRRASSGTSYSYSAQDSTRDGSGGARTGEPAADKSPGSGSSAGEGNGITFAKSAASIPAAAGKGTSGSSGGGSSSGSSSSGGTESAGTTTTGTSSAVSETPSSDADGVIPIGEAKTGGGGSVTSSTTTDTGSTTGGTNPNCRPGVYEWPECSFGTVAAQTSGCLASGTACNPSASSCCSGTACSPDWVLGWWDGPIWLVSGYTCKSTGASTVNDAVGSGAYGGGSAEQKQSGSSGQKTDSGGTSAQSNADEVKIK